MTTAAARTLMTGSWPPWIGNLRLHLATAPADRRKVITSHDAFRYFGRAYGIEFHAPVGLNTDGAPSAGEIAALIRQMRAGGIRALFVENIADPRFVRQLAREAQAVLGGTLFSDSLSGPDGPAATYVDMFRPQRERDRAGVRGL